MKKKLLAIAASLAMGLSLVGCGSDDANTLRVGSMELDGVISPIYYTTAYDGYAVDLIFDSLLDYNVDSELTPELASEMPTISEDGLTVTFKLKKGLKFSDGEKLTSEDVRFTFEVVADPSYSGRFGSTAENIVGYSKFHKKGSKVKHLKGIETPDEQTVIFHLSEPRNDAIADLGTSFGIISSKQFEGDYKKGNTKAIEEATTTTLGSGPYKLNKYDKSSGASFVKNEEFTTLEGDYSVEKIVIQHVTDSTELDALTSNSVDLLPASLSADKISSISSNDKFAYHDYARAGIGYVTFNTENGATVDPAVRKALMYGINRDAFNDSYFGWTKDASADLKEIKLGYGPKAFINPVSALGDVVRGEREVAGLPDYSYNLETAKAILDEAGWVVGADGIREKDGKALKIKFLASENNSVLDTLLPLFEKDWAKELGVSLQKTTVDMNTMFKKIADPKANGEWNAAFLAVGFTGTTLTEINTMFHSEDKEVKEKSNYAGLKDAELDTLLETARATVGDAGAAAAYEKVLVRAMEDAAYYPLYANQYFDLYNKRVKNLNTSSVYPWTKAMADVKIEDVKNKD
ncbi:MAG: ABC transporter substrate-binding protein [Erysipelotrichia bacterium]|nr:ABC transporter substrate-binding protein [Erysipelotrichia bacterium]NCC54768.1 ABC transporter substrate-binding protein [Erysipelotrichia bacterium]